MINGGDVYANVLYYCFHKLHKLPHEILRLPEAEQAFVFAAVSIKLKRDAEEAKKIKQRSSMKKGKRR